MPIPWLSKVLLTGSLHQMPLPENSMSVQAFNAAEGRLQECVCLADYVFPPTALLTRSMRWMTPSRLCSSAWGTRRTPCSPWSTLKPSWSKTWLWKPTPCTSIKRNAWACAKATPIPSGWLASARDPRKNGFQTPKIMLEAQPYPRI